MFVRDSDKTGEQLESGRLGNLNIPCILEEHLEVYERQNATGPGYSASRLAAAEPRAWMAVALQVEAELNVGKMNLAAHSLLGECVKSTVDASETFSRQSERAGFCRQAVQSVRVLGSSGTVNPRALAEPIVVGVLLQNPLDIPIHVAEVQLVASLTGAKDEGGLSGEEIRRGTSFEPAAFEDLTARLLLSSGWY